MKKKILLCLFSAITIILTGCDFGAPEKFYLDDEFYGSGKMVEITAEDFSKLDNNNYVIFTFNNFCAMAVPCEEIFDEFIEKNDVTFLSMKYDEFKKTFLHETVAYAPSVVLVKGWKIIAYLDSEKDEDLVKYQDVEEFGKWIDKYIYFEIQ